MLSAPAGAVPPAPGCSGGPRTPAEAGGSLFLAFCREIKALLEDGGIEEGSCGSPQRGHFAWAAAGGLLQLPPGAPRRALPRLLRGGTGSTGGSSSLGSLHGGSGAGIWLAPQPPVPRFGLCRRDGRGLPHGAAQGTQPALAAPWAPRLPPHPAGVPCPPSTQVTPGSLNAL